MEALPNWSILEEKELRPVDFNQTEWVSFWVNRDNVNEESGPANAHGYKITMHNDLIKKKCDFFFLRTEAIKTFLLLFSNAEPKSPDVIVLQDHGFGGNWGNQIFGYADGQTAKFYGINKVSGYMPPYLYVAENTNPWPEYEQVTEFEGKYGSAGHPRALFKLK